MGSIIEKLNYLDETKEGLKQALIEMGAEVTDEDAFASYAEKFLDATPDMKYIRSAIKKQATEDNFKPTSYKNTIIDEIGEISISYNNMFCPKIIYEMNGFHCGENLVIPFSPMPPIGSVYNVTRTCDYVSYRNVSVRNHDGDISVVFKVQMVQPKTLVLPSHVNLKPYTLMSKNTTTNDAVSFSRGLIFGQKVRSSASNWMYTSLSTTKRTVKFPEGFQLHSGETLYLSKIYISQESLQEMVKNLYDYVGTGEEEAGLNRTISLGSTNLALLTDEEKALANAKGWALT